MSAGGEPVDDSVLQVGLSYASSPRVRRQMQAMRRRDTGPELALRRILWGQGLRYRVDTRPVAGLRRKADLVFSRRLVAVFVDGCFWHACPDHGSQPRTNQQYWQPKLARNVQRDRETNAALADAGWTVVRVWEHEDPAAAAVRVADAVKTAGVRPRRRPGPRTPAATSALAVCSAAPGGARIRQWLSRPCVESYVCSIEPHS